MSNQNLLGEKREPGTTFIQGAAIAAAGLLVGLLSLALGDESGWMIFLAGVVWLAGTGISLLAVAELMNRLARR